MQRLVSISKLTNLAANGSNGFFWTNYFQYFLHRCFDEATNTDVQKEAATGGFRDQSSNIKFHLPGLLLIPL